MAVRDKGWVRARERESANSLATITALPVLVNERATGMVVYAVLIFEPSPMNWKYVTDYVGYSSSAQQAADGIFRAAAEGINARRLR